MLVELLLVPFDGNSDFYTSEPRPNAYSGTDARQSDHACHAHKIGGAAVDRIGYCFANIGKMVRSTLVFP